MASRNRGKGKPKLRDISRQSPTQEEIGALIDRFISSPPIVTAILGQAMVEHQLESLLRTRFARRDDPTWGRLTNENGPLSTFAQKIMAGYALGLYDEAALENMNLIREIRNAFAHAKRVIDFNHETISRELKNATLPKKKHSATAKTIRKVRSLKYGGSTSYVLLCFAMNSELLKRVTRSHIAANRNYKRSSAKLMARSPFFGPLANFLSNPPPIGTAGFGRWLPGDQTVDPTTQVPQSIPLSGLGLLAGMIDKKGK
jgi:hypothetical protein